MKPIKRVVKETKRKAFFLRRAVLSLASLVALTGPCLAAEEIHGDNNEPALQADARLDDTALGAVRGMGATMVLPGSLAVILWDEKNMCCNRPGPTPSGYAGEGADTHTVAFRVVIQR